MKKIIEQEKKCMRCGHEWMPRNDAVRICPNCKSAWWDVKKDKRIDQTGFKNNTLRELRKLSKHTLEEVSSSIGCDMSSMSLWENGERRPAPVNLRKIAQFFKVPVSTFFLWFFVISLAHAGVLNQDGTAVSEVAKEYIINLPANQHARVSPHFTAKEFACSHCGKRKVDGKLLYKLELLRIELGGKKIRISSGYRCKIHNSKIHGAKRSQHLSGTAADIQVEEFTPAQVAKAAERAGFSFIKIYPRHTHVDVR